MEKEFSLYSPNAQRHAARRHPGGLLAAGGARSRTGRQQGKSRIADSVALFSLLQESADVSGDAVSCGNRQGSSRRGCGQRSSAKTRQFVSCQP